MRVGELRLYHETLTLLDFLRGFLRYVVTLNSLELIPTSGHVYEERAGEWRCACGAVTT